MKQTVCIKQKKKKNSKKKIKEDEKAMSNHQWALKLWAMALKFLAGTPLSFVGR